MKYGQSYYTLRSIFFDGVPPPVIHMHLRVFDVGKDVPIGDICAESDPDIHSDGTAVEVDCPDEVKRKFDLWLQNIWRDKDDLIVKFHERGSFVVGKQRAGALDIPLELRHKREILDAFCFFIPALVGYISAKLRRGE
jgi:hypothetical protein